MLDHIEAVLDYECSCKYRVEIGFDTSRGDVGDYGRTFVVVKESRLLAVIFEGDPDPKDKDRPHQFAARVPVEVDVEEKDGKAIFRRMWDDETFRDTVGGIVDEHLDEQGVFAGGDDIAKQERHTRASTGL